MKKVFVRGPILSRSGYGEHARFLMRSLRKYEGRLFDIYAHSTNWGHTGWEIEDDEERQWLDNIFKKTQEYAAKEGKFDLSLQVTIPNEWEKLADINVGVTAGIETTMVAPIWLQKAWDMDKIITISQHSKTV